MKIATFNCNSVRSRLGIILDWLATHEPDMLGLQETKVTDEQFPLEPFVEAGWQVAYRGQKSYNGVAVITRQKPKFVNFGFGDGLDNDEDSSTRMAHVQLGGVHLINTYVPQGRDLEHEKFQFKLAWFERLHTYLQANFKSPSRNKVVWVGDLNVAPEPMDVHDHDRIWPHVCHCEEVIEAFGKVRDWGFVDVFRKHLPDAGTYTYWDYRVRGAISRGLGWRIDHILATLPVAKHSTSVMIDVEARRLEKPSDHTFVMAEFAL